ncbi:oxoglutarate/iron-dependent oxygenase [Niveomyces insectorum RCEF 264]|uniref:uS12 prolyl 3,4-dihydroxylase n=1 Tax=Niveomyces insectorum RCEF 264 TaxID=1081102 RepID=A0A167WXU6_9HYPO|nr:oxoglutarate/iron-dependent oxygenase [Niveomyces insectorum RCEF 264]
MKRKADTPPAGAETAKRTKKDISTEKAKQRFRKDLFDEAVLDGYTRDYAASAPYKHAVIHELVNDALLRAVRDEIRENVSFTPKETDIYKIHQSGDLANLDGLEDEALAKLPSLLALRDALYSEAFRGYVSHITGCGPLSGRKTDMAVNVYTPGSYLLCHDDVIGSRKVSYILYLTDPDTPWQSAWGGALRLYPVLEQAGPYGEVAKTPGPEPVKVIPPAWNQLSFFAVQPGESFHDVEEVYHAESPAALARDGGRVRMAISGWFHIPQPGEAGFVPGAEAAQMQNSSLMQLQGNPDQHDRPQAKPVVVGGAGEGTPRTTATKEGGDASDSQDSRGSQEFNEADLEFLLQYLAPTYLTPDTLTGIAEHFEENSSITLPTILKASFAERLREDIVKREAAAASASASASASSTATTTAATDDAWQVAKPPHKHRFLYLQPGDAPADSPWHELLDVLLPSMPFRTWLEMATNTTVESFDLTARRFRRGQDYTLATGHSGPARLELNLGLTPTHGWGDDADEEEEEDDDDDDNEVEEAAESDEEATNGKGKAKAEVNKPKPGAAANGQSSKTSDEAPQANNSDAAAADAADVTDVGGHEVYMAGDDDEDEAENNDAAIYRASGDDDNILFFQAAAWNKMTLVLRDSGTLRFVKYVSRAAPGDRWDVSATFDIAEGDDEDEDGDGDNGDHQGNAAEASHAQLLESSSEEEFRGFSSSEDSDSD